MADRYRDLERPQNGRIKDAVLMATVTSFEGLRQPRASDLRQFSELFEPLFDASTDEARRQAAAALARCPHVPPAIALQIASAPISIAALFLTRAGAIDDNVLMTVIRHQSAAHANAIARRETLSVRVVDALVERRHSAPVQHTAPGVSAESAAAAPDPLAAPSRPAGALEREEKLRAELKALARVAATAHDDLRRALEPVDATSEALLIRFARTGEVNLFAATLSHALDCSTTFGERLVLDVSGWQLAVSLSALGFGHAEMIHILTALYPYLAERMGPATRCDAMLEGIKPQEARRKVEGWIAADDHPRGTARHDAQQAPERADDPRTAANHQRPQVVSTFYRRAINRAAR